MQRQEEIVCNFENIPTICIQKTDPTMLHTRVYVEDLKDFSEQYKNLSMSMLCILCLHMCSKRFSKWEFMKVNSRQDGMAIEATSGIGIKKEQH